MTNNVRFLFFVHSVQPSLAVQHNDDDADRKWMHTISCSCWSQHQSLIYHSM